MVRQLPREDRRLDGPAHQGSTGGALKEDAERDGRWALGLFLGLLALYWRGRSSSFGAGDSPQHVLSALTWGVSWPPGYPLYTFLAHLFSRLPVASPESLVNGFSGLCHAAACAVLFLLLRRSKLETGPALFAPVLMAFSPLYWYYSEVAEVRALNDLLAVLAAYCAILWTDTRKDSRLYALGAVLGLGISHHPTYVLLLPAIAYWLWRNQAWPSARRSAVFAGVVLAACAAPYLILGVRLRWSEPVYNPMGVRGWRGVLDLFLRKNLGGPLRMVGGRGFFDLGGFKWEPLAAQAGWLLRSAIIEPGPGILLALSGAAALWKRGRAVLGFWGVWLGASLACFLFISSQQLHLHDPDYARAIAMRFYLMPFVGLFALAGAGAQWLLERARPAGWHWFVRLAMAATCAATWVLNDTNLKGHDPLLGYGRDILASSGPSDIVILAADDTVLVENYLDYVRHETGDRVFLNPVLFAFKPYLAELKSRYPRLNLPPAGPAGLPMDWHLWQKLNPSRKLYSEVMFLTILSKDFKGLAPHGALVAVSDKPAHDTPAEAAGFLASTSVSRLASGGLYGFTQEIYLARTAGALLAWYGSRLDERKDAALIAEIRSRLTAPR
ncbi:MAG: DUF2723 domain-containing protein [Elusimicrobia bacterium]|nr:DUF2723 domain-containing protein [Elusimicrobiota bacterium]